MISVLLNLKKPVLTFLALTALTGAAQASVQTWIDAPMSGWMEKTIGEKVTQGNKVDFLVDGTEFWPVRLDMIKNAKTSIDLFTYLWCDDEVGLRVADELVAAHQRGVRVRVMIDLFNSSQHKKAYEILSHSGPNPLIFNPTYWGIDGLNDHATHEKIMVVDGKEALVGGANLCNEYMIGLTQPLWHDLELHVQGPIAARIQQRWDATYNWMSDQDFNARWGQAALTDDIGRVAAVARKYPYYPDPTPVSMEPMGDAPALFMYQQAYMDGRHGEQYEMLYSELVKRARHKVVIYMPYVNPPEMFEKAILETARRGVDVTLISNSKATNDEPIAIASAFNYYGPMLAAGVKIYEYQPRTVHAKAILVDDLVVSIGSHNYTHRSFRKNGEGNILVGDQEVIQKFNRMIVKDISESKRLTTAVYRAETNPDNHVKATFWGMVARWFRGLF